jgi:uncharacterized protein (TIGR03382 family)
MNRLLLLTLMAACGDAPEADSGFANDQEPRPANSGFVGSQRLDSTASWSASGSSASQNFAAAVAIVDVDNDGYDDIFLGASSFESTSSHRDEGALYQYMSTSAGASTSRVVWQSDNNYRRAGIAVAAAGNVNADLYQDLVVGAEGNNSSSNAQAGAVYLFFGSSTGLVEVAEYSPSPDRDDYFGHAVDGAGDVDGDGYDDVIVGAYGDDDGVSGGGGAFLYSGATTGLVTSPLLRVVGTESGGELGYSVAGAGDVNGDGYDDILLGAPTETGDQNDSGRAHVHLGSSTGPADTPEISLDGEFSGDHFGMAVASVGDLDNDGLGDIAVGAPFNDPTGGSDNNGTVYVYYGVISTGPSTTPDASLSGTTNDAVLGTSIAGGADFNNDGYDDVLVGAQVWSGSYSSEGAAFAFWGSPSGLGTTATWTAAGGQNSAYAGTAVAVGNPNGDDYADALVGVPGYDGSVTNDGAAWLYNGGSSDVDEDGYDDEAYGGTDCDDGDAAIHPAASEICDGVDNDCDGSLDATENDSDLDGYVECTIDGGGWDGDDSVVGGDDCDDTEPDVHPNAAEYCDDVDHDCDGSDTANAVDPTSWYTDGDGDGFGDGESGAVESCDSVDGRVDNRLDCDDGESAVSPDADEVCFDAVDNDCNGETDDQDAVDATTWYADSDGDGYGDDGEIASQRACDEPSGQWSEEAGDCDEGDDKINPGADEICNDADDDCNGEVDDDPIDAPTWYEDEDQDGYGAGSGTRFCSPPGEGYTDVGDDCDDDDSSIHPDAEEADDPDGIDQDCDGAKESQWISGGSPYGCSTSPSAPLPLWALVLLLVAPLTRRRS